MKSHPTKQFQTLVPQLREKGFYISQKERKISWSIYNLNRINDLKESLTFIREEVDNCNILSYNRAGRPLTNVKSLAKAILFCELFQIPERQAQGYLEIIGSYLGISELLDDKVIGDAYNHFEVLYILKQIFERNKNSDGILSGDGTGLETSRKQNYESQKKTNGYMTSIIDSREIVQAFDISGMQECRAMHNLVKEVEGKSLRLDAGFVDRELVKLLGSIGLKPYIFPKKNILLNSKGNKEWTRLYLELLYNVQNWLKEYHQRSHAESFHSAFKRRFGIVTKRNPTNQLSQITARIILHNRTRNAYFSKLASSI